MAKKQPVISKFFTSVSSKNKTSISNKKKEDEVVVIDLQKDFESESSDSPKHSKVGASAKRLEIFKRNNEYTGNTDTSNGDFANKLNKIMVKRARYGKVIDQTDATDSVSDTNDDAGHKSKKTKNNGKLTPLDQQVKDMKAMHPEKLLVIRVGYKYKCFAQDAIIVSKILHIMLVPGKLTFDDSNPQDFQFKQLAYCSFPDVRLKVHLERIVHHNYKVAVVEQTETSAIKKFGTQSNSKSGVFERKISGIFSKATFGVNSTFETDQKTILGNNSTIWAISSSELQGKQISVNLLSVNLNSGEILYDTFEEAAMFAENLKIRIKYLNPVETLICSKLPEQYKKFLKEAECNLLERESKHDITADTFEKVMTSEVPAKFNDEMKQLVASMFDYLTEYNNEKILLLSENYKCFNSKTHMILNSKTIENLDIFSNNGGKGSLFWLLDHTNTPFGTKCLSDWILRPLLNRADIEDRLNAIDCITKEAGSVFFDSLNQMLRSMPDLMRTLNRISYGSTSRKEIYFFLKKVKLLNDHFQTHYKYIDKEILKPDGRVFTQSALIHKIFNEILRGLKQTNPDYLLSMINVSAVMEKDKKKQVAEFFNLNNYNGSDEIVKIQSVIDEIKNEFNDELSAIRALLKRPHLTFKDEVEYLIEVRNTQLKGIPNDWVVVNTTKMISRFHTPQTRKLLENLEYQNDLLHEECKKQYKVFLLLINEEYYNLKSIIQNLGIYDSILSLAATSKNFNYCRPTFSSQQRFIKAKNARNPIIESLDVNYVPNDINLSQKDGSFLIITGPNMGGKSSYIRMTALIVILAQIGSFVPADSLEIGIVDNILTRIGANDRILQGESTFKVELLDILDIIKNSSENSLLLLDEVGRGTSTEDGKAISFALIEYFVNLPNCPLSLFTTHYPSLADIPSSCIANYYMDFVEKQSEGESWSNIVFLYKLKKGVTDTSYGLNVARMANIDTSIINNAHNASERLRFEEIANSDIQLLNKLKNIFKKIKSSPQISLEQLIQLIADII